MDRAGKDKTLDRAGEVKACTHAAFDLRVGGKFTIAGDRAPGGEEHDVLGVYARGRPQCARLVYTWAWASTPERESLVTVEFKPEGDGTLLTLTHAQFFDEDARDRHQQGWAGALDKLEKFVA